VSDGIPFFRDLSPEACEDRSSNMALQRTRRPRLRSGRSPRSLGSPLNARPLGRRHVYRSDCSGESTLSDRNQMLKGSFRVRSVKEFSMRRSSITRALILAVFAIIPLGARYQLVLAQDQFEHPKFPPAPHERQQPAVERNL